MDNKVLIVTEEGRMEENPIWQSKKGMIPIAEMDDDYLVTAYNYAQQREYHFTKKALIFSEKITQLERELEKRKIEVKPLILR